MTKPTKQARVTDTVDPVVRHRWPCPRCGGKLIFGTGGDYWCPRCKSGRRL